MDMLCIGTVVLVGLAVAAAIVAYAANGLSALIRAARR
jgi:hypothetical protein